MKLGIPSLAIAVLLAHSLSQADELKLKDGTKIVGTIVGFEENSFKVKTSYGFAVVQKDQVASISISSEANAKSALATKTDPPPLAPGPKPAPAAEASAASASASAPPAPSAPLNKPALAPGKSASETRALPPAITVGAKPPKPETLSASKPAQPANSSDPSAAPVTRPTPAHEQSRDQNHDQSADTVSPRSAKASAAATLPAPSPAAALEPIREQVVGNTYTNETFGFQMYKPPTWEVIAGVPSLLPGAIAAMGTNDQTTYLLVGQEPAGNPVDSVRDRTQRRLRDIMDNFRSLGETSVTVSGTRATEIRFRGGVDEHDWSGVAVFVTHGSRLFTIFGMTLADSDLVQIQENVIARTISSLQFTNQ